MPRQLDARRRPAAFRSSIGVAAVAVLLALPDVGFGAVIEAQGEARCAVPDAAPAVVLASPLANEGGDESDAIRRAGPVPASPTPGAPLSDASLTPRPATPTPTATPTPVPDPQAMLEAELLATARALAACLGDGPPETVVDLATEGYLGQLYAGGEPLAPDEYLLLAPDLDPVPVRILDLSDVREQGNDATADVTSIVGNQILTEEWRFVDGSSTDRAGESSAWRVDGSSLLAVEPPQGADEIDVTLAEYAISIAPPTPVGGDVVLRGSNVGAEDHEMLVLRFDDGFTTADLLRTAGPSLPDETRWIGQATLPAGETGEIVLTDLEPGTYTIVCLLPTVRGTPHLALGMAATFAVE